MKRLSLFFFSLLLSSQLFAQAPLPAETEKTVQNHQNWFTYFGQFKLSENLGIHTDVQFRKDEKVQFTKQNLLRAGLIKYFNPNLNFTAGYAYINSQNVGLNDYATEHRIWEQLIYAHKPANLNMTHRFRLEQRFVERLFISGDGSIKSNYDYGNRFRYFNRTIFDLTRNTEAQNVFYVALQDEIFLNFASPDINKNTFDQNRFLVAFGVFHDKKTRLELGYMNQFINPYKRANTMNHIFHVSVLQTLNFMAPPKPDPAITE
ncbi:MAG TPA: DUF2490 domain-containing protein [Adhaeribacter sp.]|nr:DUF2490 domain-containing protein [Adhaeribacter sp.]